MLTAKALTGVEVACLTLDFSVCNEGWQRYEDNLSAVREGKRIENDITGTGEKATEVKDDNVTPWNPEPSGSPLLTEDICGLEFEET